MSVTITKARPEDAGELLGLLKIIGGETDNLRSEEHTSELQSPY